ncbi:MAG: AsmA family protein [Gallionellaceae bacterium]
MNKVLKYSLLTLAGACTLLLAGGAYVAATFNPNDYKSQLIQAVKDNKQRTLKLDGDIKLTLFPSVGADLGKVSLSEFKSDKEFAAIEGAHVSLALLPLFSGQAVVDKVVVKGLKATLVKFKNGKTNISDLLATDAKQVEDKDSAKDEPSNPIKFDIASVLVEKTELHYSDETSGALYDLNDIKLKTGRIANGIPSKLSFAAHIKANQPNLDITTKLKTTLTFDLDKQLFVIKGLDLQAKGAALDISNLDFAVSGGGSANLGSSEFSAEKLMISATGTKAKDTFDTKLELSAFDFSKGKVSGNQLNVNAKLNGESGDITAKLALPKVEGGSEFFKTSPLTLDVDIKQQEMALAVKISALVAGNIKGKQLNLADLIIAVTATGDKLPNKSLSSELKGSVQVDGHRHSVSVNLAGGLLQSQIKAKVGLHSFSKPKIRFDIDVDKFDADLYMPKKPQGDAEAKSKKLASATTEEKPFDLSALQKLNMEGTLRIGTLKVANVTSTQLRIDVKARKGHVKLSPLSANFYQGTINGSVTINAARSVPSFVINEKLSGVNIAPLLKDAADFDMLEGKGKVTLNLATQGNTVSALKKALNGKMALNLANGAVKGINIAKKIREAGSMLGKKSQTQNPSKDEKTDFSEMKASFKIKNGVAHNNDLSLKSPLLRISGNGDINLVNDSINYLAKAKLTTTLKGQGGNALVKGLTVPVRLSGPFTALKYQLDFGAMVGDAVKEKIKTKVKTKLQDKLKEGLKGLFR